MSDIPIFIADYEYSSRNDGELEFKVGDKIFISKIDGDWLFGSHAVTKKEGWVAQSYGHIRKPSPFASLQNDVKIQKRKEIFEASIVEEKQFVDTLKEIVDQVVVPMNLRDTVFKRNFLADAGVAVSFSLLVDIHKTCSNFLLALQQSNTNEQSIAAAHIQFAPSLQLFAQYASENSKLINALEKNRRALAQMLENAGDFNLVAKVLSPLQHYQKYRNDFQQYVWLTPDTNSHSATLEAALDVIIAQSEYVDVKLKEEEEHLMLLTLQSRFVGNPVIFTPTRKLLREGEIDRVREKKNGEIETKTYYAHLFNDALIYSSRSAVTGYFKVHGTIELRGATFQTHEIGGTKAGFSLSSRDTPEKFDHFKLSTEEEAMDWFPVIIHHIEQLKKAKRAEKRTSIMTKAPINIPGVDVTKLGPRCSLIYKFLINEMQFAEALVAMNITLIQPLIDASKGAVLSAVANSRSADSTELTGNSSDLYDSRAATTSKYQSQLITNALQDPDVLIFLRAAEGISHGVRDFVKSLESICSGGKWNENIVVGNFFVSHSALALYDQFKSYASGQQAMVRVLKNPNFAQFQKDAEIFLANVPGKLQEKLELPRKRIMFYHSVISDLQKVTAGTHPDYPSINVALEKITLVDTEITELIKLKENFEKLLEIQASLITMGNEPVVQKLVTMERKFLREGDLKKVCRRKNKTFRFWLFHDYLIYASALGGDTYSFNRALELNKCSVAAHNSNDVKNAFEIYGAEKSFVVIAPTQTVCDEWIEAIKTAAQSLRAARGESELQESAPLWTPDHNSDTCTQCDKPFTFWNRRHHCRKCGALVCSEHLNHREIIPHISKTQKQKICDNCFSGKTTTAKPTVDTTGTGNNPSEKQPSPKPVTTTATTATTASTATDKPKTSSVEIKVNPLQTSNLAQKYLQSVNSPSSPNNNSNNPPEVTSKPPVTKTPSVSESNNVSSVVKAHRRTSVVASKFAKKSAPPPDAVNTTVTEKPEVHTLNAKARWPPAAVAKPESSPPPLPARRVEAPPPVPASPPPAVPTSKPPEVKPEAGPPPLPRSPPPAVPTTAPPPTPPPVASTAIPPAIPPAGPPSVPPPAVPPVSDVAARPARPPPPPPKHAPPPPPPTHSQPPPVPPPIPPSPVTATQTEPVAEDDPFRKYIKMKEMLPEGAVRQKMTADGFNSNDIEAFLSGKLARIAIPSNDFTANVSAVKLNATPSTPAPPPNPGKMSLLEEIQKGSKLKAVIIEDTKAEKVQATGGLLGMLAMEMSKRRFNMNVNEDEDDDSDSGFSSSSDSEDD